MAKLSEEDAAHLEKRLQKRRIKREEEIAPSSASERQQFMYSIVLKAISAALDSQTNYFTPAEASQFMIQVSRGSMGSVRNCEMTSMALRSCGSWKEGLLL